MAINNVGGASGANHIDGASFEIPDIPETPEVPDLAAEQARLDALVALHANANTSNAIASANSNAPTVRIPPGVDPAAYMANANVGSTSAATATNAARFPNVTRLPDSTTIGSLEHTFIKTFDGRPMVSNADAQAIIDEFAAMLPPHLTVEGVSHARLDNMTIKDSRTGQSLTVDFIFSKWSDDEIAKGERIGSPERIQWIPKTEASQLADGGKLSPENKQAFLDWIKQYPAWQLVTAVNDFVAERKKKGDNSWDGTIVVNHDKRLDKVQFPNGMIVDVVVGAGSANAQMGGMWQEEGIHPPATAATRDLPRAA